MIELVQLLDHNDHFLTDLSTRKCELNKFLVLETVQHQQTVGRLFESECCVKFGFRAGLEAKVVTGTLAQVLFNHCTLLVYLHRINTHVITLIIEFSN
jgi:hypothetical protein